MQPSLGMELKVIGDVDFYFLSLQMYLMLILIQLFFQAELILRAENTCFKKDFEKEAEAAPFAIFRLEHELAQVSQTRLTQVSAQPMAHISAATGGAGFGPHTIGAGFYGNTISASFRDNTIGASFRDNTIGSNFYGNTIGAGFKMNEVADKAIASVDFTAATHVYGAYNCYLYKRPDGTAKLRYYDNSDVQQIVLPTA